MIDGNAVYCELRFWMACFERTLVPWALAILRIRRGPRKRFKLLRIEWIDEQRSYLCKTLAEKSPGESINPRVTGEEVVEKVELPPVRLYHFNEAVCHSQSASFILGNRILLERVPGADAGRCLFVNGMIRRHGWSRAMIYEVPSERLERGIFLGGNGVFNYYHWMVEILPKLEFINTLGIEFDDYPLLVDESALNIPSIRTGLDLLKGDRKILPLCKDRHYKVESLLHVTPPNLSVFNLRERYTFHRDDCLVRRASVLYLRNELFDRFKDDATAESTPKRVFLARRNQSREYNQDEVFSVLERAGFVKIYPEDFSLEEQVRLFANTEMVAGPSGAAWTNLIFCRKGTKGICWVDEMVITACPFSSLAHSAGVDLHYATYQSGMKNCKDFWNADYSLDIAEVSRVLNQLLAVNVS